MLLRSERLWFRSRMFSPAEGEVIALRICLQAKLDACDGRRESASQKERSGLFAELGGPLFILPHATGTHF